MTFPQIVESYGYVCTTHSVTTRDGYILTVFRIRSKSVITNSQPVALLWHGLLDSAYTWIYSGAQALPFSLCNQGYDVWLANNRGTSFSLRHAFMPSSHVDFWKFTWDDFARFDLPDVVNFIKKETDTTSISYVGHSEGTTQMFACLSENPEFASNLNCFIGLGPAVFTSHVRGVMRLLAALRVDKIVWKLGFRRSFMPSPNALVRSVLSLWCTLFPWTVDDVLALLCGRLDTPMDPNSMSDWVKHEPSGTSVLNMIHWAQMIRSQGRFSKFDFGVLENLRRYGQRTPPEYPLANIPKNLPMFLISGQTDTLADHKDVLRLLAELQDCKLTTIEVSDFDHTDLVWSQDAPTKVFSPALEFVKKHTPIRPSLNKNQVVQVEPLAQSWMET
eukprot:c2132_g1_i1.p1 GENE.c2132_g1_i1~~c2132_g1_i1.p1  ORF type:complete len:429 (-),score=61.21 c2132_g1_i1:71-1237(-)